MVAGQFSIVVECLIQCGMRQREIAKALGVSDPTVHRWRQGEAEPSVWNHVS